MIQSREVGGFPLGQIVFTGNAASRLRLEEVLTALRRHASGDWGNVLPEDAIVNDLALRSGGRLFIDEAFGVSLDELATGAIAPGLTSRRPKPRV